MQGPHTARLPCVLCALQFDLSYAFVCLLERLGLAWDVRRPTEAQKAAKRRKQPAPAA